MVRDIDLTCATRSLFYVCLLKAFLLNIEALELYSKLGEDSVPDFLKEAAEKSRIAARDTARYLSENDPKVGELLEERDLQAGSLHPHKEKQGEVSRISGISVGEKVCKIFNGKPFTGTITEIRPAEAGGSDELYSVVYSDGDAEEMWLEEVVECIDLYEKEFRTKRQRI